MNFPDVESLKEAEFLAPPPCLLTDDDRALHRQEQRRLAITERDERLMQQWCEEHLSDVQDEEAFFTSKRARGGRTSLTARSSPSRRSRT
jgi:hypothetical protein